MPFQDSTPMPPFANGGTMAATKRDLMKAALAATALLAAGESSHFLDLAAQYRALEDEYNAYPDDVALAAEQRWIVKSTILEEQMAEAPITSAKAALEAMRLVNHRMDGSEATHVDRAILRNVQIFMEG